MSTLETSYQERREDDRVEVSEVIRVIDRQTGTVLGRLVNISEEGFLLQGPQPINEDNILQLSLEFDPEVSDADPILVGAESLWCRSSNDQAQYWTGFFIIDISEKDHERVRHLTG